MPFADPESKRQFQKEYYRLNRERLLAYSKLYHQQNRARLKPKKDAWKRRNPEKVRRSQQKAALRRRALGIRYVESAASRKRRLERCRRNFRQRYKKDLAFTLLRVLRLRLHLVVNGRGSKGRAVELLGCSIETFRGHIESQFQAGMSWANYGLHGWHIDHIMPCAVFDLRDPEQVARCFHYTNMRPVWAHDNLRKSSRVEGELPLIYRHVTLGGA